MEGCLVAIYGFAGAGITYYLVSRMIPGLGIGIPGIIVLVIGFVLGIFVYSLFSGGTRFGPRT